MPQYQIKTVETLSARRRKVTTLYLFYYKALKKPRRIFLANSQPSKAVVGEGRCTERMKILNLWAV